MRSPVEPLVSTSSSAPDASSARTSRPAGTHCLGSAARTSFLKSSGSAREGLGEGRPG